MSELLTNYWVGLLVLGPIAGAFWTLLFRREQRQSSGGAEYNLEGNSGQIVVGSNNHTKHVKNSYNRKVVNNYSGGSDKSGDDPMALGILAIVGIILVGVLLSWGMAKYGEVIVVVEMALVSVIGACLLFHLVSKYLRCEYEKNELLCSLTLIASVAFSFLIVGNLNEYLRDDVTDMVDSYTNVVEFFFDLSPYGRTLLITQALSVICVLISQMYIVIRAYGLQVGRCSWYLDAFIFIPIFGVLPFWLSNPDLSVSFILERLA